MSGKRPQKKAPAKAGTKIVDRARIAYKFSDGSKHMATPADVLLQQMKQWFFMAESDDPEMKMVGMQRLREVALAASEKVLSPIGSGRGGTKAAQTKAKHAAANKARALRRFRMLVASGERDATEAIEMMVAEGFSRSALYEHTKEERQRLRGKPVKRSTTRKKVTPPKG